MIYFYTDKGGHLNLCAPYIASSLWINPQVYPIIEELVYRYGFSEYNRQIIRLRQSKLSFMCKVIGGLNQLMMIHRQNDLEPPFYFNYVTTHSNKINYYGEDVCIAKAEKELYISTKAALFLHNIECDFKYLSLESELRSVEGIILYFYTGVLRQRYFDNYHHYYPDLNLSSNLGQISQDIESFTALCNLKYLPEFFIWTKTIKIVESFIVKNYIDCKWLEKEKQRYGNLK